MYLTDFDLHVLLGPIDIPKTTDIAKTNEIPGGYLGHKLGAGVQLGLLIPTL